MKKGIDVSAHNGSIDWGRAKKDIDFAMLRAGFGKGNVDKHFHENAKGCISNGIPFGVYWFSYAITVDDARAEAQHCLDAIKGYTLDYPIAFDFEYDSDNYFIKKVGRAMTTARKIAIAQAFCETVEKAGYYVSIYTNLDYFNKCFKSLANKYDIWLARWNAKSSGQVCGMWQYTERGCVTGIKTVVDCNYSYKDYPKIIETMRKAVKETGAPSGKVYTADELKKWCSVFYKNSPDVVKKYQKEHWDRLVDVAVETVRGKYGNGDTRVRSLKAAGYDPIMVQLFVNCMTTGSPSWLTSLG